MFKKEFASYLAQKHNCTPKEAMRIIKLFTSSVAAALSENKEVTLMDFGKFYVSKIVAKKGFNINTREVVVVPEQFMPRFRAGKNLKKVCN